MEAILVDVKRMMRSILGMAHADSGARKLQGVGFGSRSSAGYRSIGRGEVGYSDLYGRAGRSDMFSGREFAEFYGKIAAFDSHRD